MLIKEIITIAESDNDHATQLKKTGFWGKQAAGCIIMAQDTGRFCIAHRSAYVEQPNTWGTWGGAVDQNETPAQAVIRELQEEAGYNGQFKLIPLYVFNHPSGFRYSNFLAIVESEFQPKLDWENQGYVWTEWGDWPSPLHFGLKSLFTDQTSIETMKKHMPQEKIQESILNEGGTDVLYHFSSVNSAVGILQSGEFLLSSSTGVGMEQRYAPRGYPYFMSTSRTKTGDYHRYVGTAGVMFVLDGRWLSQRYVIKPVDYWDRMWLNTARTSESEDRIFSKSNSIPITPVKQIHVLIKEQDPRVSPHVRQVLILCKQKQIPAFLYTEESQWRVQNIRAAVSPSQIQQLLRGHKPSSLTFPPREYMKRWIELIVKDSKQQLSKEADRLRYNIMYYNDVYKTLDADMHNARKPGDRDYKNVVKINDYMRQNRYTTTQELIKALAAKWRTISNPTQSS
jgi:8-oxo-dGTP pyrophosphatase MutT (NUDIX family)